MWRPQSIEEFEQAVTTGALEEKHDFDAKRELPSNGKELAKDIAAMSTDGGALVYGVEEDGNEQPRIPTPLELAGARERVDQVAQHSISPTPRIEFVLLRLPDDDGRGYLVVLIPASPQAPHQVTVGDDRRYYGRCETGNRRLSEIEIARLYERRERLNVDREKLLEQCIASSPVGPAVPGKHGYLQAFAQPALRDDQLWDHAVEREQGNEQLLLRHLGESVRSVRADWGGAHLGVAPNWRQRGADKWSLDTGLATDDPDALPVRRRAIADLSMDGRCYLFYGGAADANERSEGNPPPFLLYERGLSLNLAQFLALVGSFFEAGGLYGQIDVGMAVTGIRGATSAHLYNDHLGSTPYQDEGAFRTGRFDARLLTEDPTAIRRYLLDRLLKAISDGQEWDPLASGPESQWRRV